MTLIPLCLLLAGVCVALIFAGVAVIRGARAGNRQMEELDRLLAQQRIRDRRSGRADR